MVEKIMGDMAFQFLRAGLEVASLRQQVISNNIANVNNPDFQPLKVEFESLMTNNTAASIPKPHVTIKSNVKEVSIDQEMVNLSQNTVQYQALLKQLNGKLELLNSAINGR